MIIDYQNGNQCTAPVTAAPDYAFPAQPLQDDQIIETEQAEGTTGGVSVSLTGTVND